MGDRSEVRAVEARRDERDRDVRAEEHADHARWAAQHAAWAEEARAWERELDAEVTMGWLAPLLEAERARLAAHLEDIRRHEAQIAQHEVLLAALDHGGCLGCEAIGGPEHARAGRAHGAEQTSHEELRVRRRRIREQLGALRALLEEEP